MLKIRNEKPVKILFFLIVCFISYNFILKPLSLSTAVPFFLRLPILRCDDFFANSARNFKPLPKEIEQIVVVSIDNESLRMADQKWPWKRSTFARLVDGISAQGPKAIYLDFAFSGKSEDETEDIILAESLKKAGNVVLGGYIDEEAVYNFPQEKFVLAAKEVGFVNKKIFVADQLVRGMRLIFRGGENTIDYGAEIKILAVAAGISSREIVYSKSRITLPGISPISASTGGFLTINYSASANDFLNIPARRILSGEPPLAADVLKDKIVLVGMTANVTHDIHSTPQGLMPGINIIAESLLMLLAGNFVNSFSDFGALAVILLLTLFMGFVAFRLRWVYSALILFFLLSGVSLSYLYLKIRYNFAMDIFGALFMPAVSFGAVGIYKYLTLLMEAEGLKLQAISDSLTGAYTQRYFQLNARNLLEKRAVKNKFFGYLKIYNFKELESAYPGASGAVIKKIAGIIKSRLLKKSLWARYGEYGFTFIMFKNDLKILEIIAKDSGGYEFKESGKSFKARVSIAVVPCAQAQFKNYEDLLLTCEEVLKRAEAASLPVAIFDIKADKIISTGPAGAEGGALPKNELSYVSIDLEARNQELIRALEDLKKEQKKVEDSYFNTMHSLVKALEEKDQYTAGHSERVVKYAFSLAEGLNLSKDETENIRRAAYLHDIGKIGLPDKILHKKEKLDDSEYELIKRHQSDGIKILDGLPFFNDIAPFILYHHERYDGKGYPYGLSGDMIPRGAQIIAVGDSFDAMTTGRGYNKPLTLPEAVEELKKGSGAQFNPIYAAKFVELLEQKKIYAF